MPNQTQDKYDKQIAYLTKNPNEIRSQWMRAVGLFQFTGNYSASPDRSIGCLVMLRVKPNIYNAPTEKLKTAIANDERIPKEVGDITIESLQAFAEWQRRIDGGMNANRTQITDLAALHAGL